MTKKHLLIADEPGEPLVARIAMGLHKLGLAMKQHGVQQASEEGLSATQGQILAALVSHGPLSGTELSERIGVTLPTISESVSVLVAKGLVTKQPDPRHPRASLITPTRRGAAAGTRARAWPEFMASAVSTLSPDEQRAFFAGIVKMISTLQQQGLVPLDGMCITCTQFRPNVRTGKTPHHCALIDQPLAAEHLRVDCPDHELASEAVRRTVHDQIVRAG